MKNNKLIIIPCTACFSFIKKLIIVLTIVIGTSIANGTLLVDNIIVSQEEGSEEVNIVYDLAGAPAEGASIVVKISQDGGGFTLDPSTLSGDAGIGVQNGTGKTIVWNCKEDLGVNVEFEATFQVTAYDGKATADPDVVMKPVGIGIVNGKVTDTLEWDLQSDPAVDNLQYSPFWCSETSVTAAQYLNFLKAYQSRFPDKFNPACYVTSVFNNAQGGAWVEIYPVEPDVPVPLCTLRTTPVTSANNASSKIGYFNFPVYNYSLIVTDWRSNQPMTEVAWCGAVAYCMWLNEEEFGSDMTKWKYRLPTEWEYEFMMGAKTISSTSGGKQDWGNASWDYATCHDTVSHTHNADDWVNYGSDGTYGLHGVGTKPVADQSKGYGQNATNVFGCYELSGNVWALCMDWYGSSVLASGKNYVRRTQTTTTRSRRGGSFSEPSSYTQPDSRNHAVAPHDCLVRVGFKIVRDR